MKIGKKLNGGTIVLVFILGICCMANAKTIYVDAGADPGGDGSNWATAYKYLQDALYEPPADRGARCVSLPLLRW